MRGAGAAVGLMRRAHQPGQGNIGFGPFID
jgi:hypothetical protein